MNTEEVIAEEIAIWRVRESEVTDEDKHKLHGAACCLVKYKNKSITLSDLRSDYAETKRRSVRAEMKDMEWDIMARNRANYAAKAIKQLGLRLKELDLG